MATPTSSVKITTLEACQILFKGQSNVKIMANRLGITLSEMQGMFRMYCEQNPATEDAWRKDVDLSWPYIT